MVVVITATKASSHISGADELRPPPVTLTIAYHESEKHQEQLRVSKSVLNTPRVSGVQPFTSS